MRFKDQNLQWLSDFLEPPTYSTVWTFMAVDISRLGVSGVCGGDGTS